MDWLRSEDLKEEKSVTAPWLIVAVEAHCVLSLSGGIPRTIEHEPNTPTILDPVPPIDR